MTTFRGWDRRLKDVLTGVSTSSRRHFRYRHLASKMAAPEVTSTMTWSGLFDPHCGGGARWWPFRFRPPSWMTSFAKPEMRSSKKAAGGGRAAILRHRHNWDRKGQRILLTFENDVRVRIMKALRSIYHVCQGNRQRDYIDIHHNTSLCCRLQTIMDNYSLSCCWRRYSKNYNNVYCVGLIDPYTIF